jgi:hypothetical protein
MVRCGMFDSVSGCQKLKINRLLCSFVLIAPCVISAGAFKERNLKRDLADPELFGNEAGEDEDAAVLDSYFIRKPDFERFYTARSRLAFVRSRKGMGKSALLTHAHYQRHLADDGDLLIYIKASDLLALQTVQGESPAELIFGWQQRICTRINLELGSTLKLGFTDDSILLIESAEINGFRSRNIAGALIDRLKLKGLGAEIERQRVGVGDSQKTLARILEAKDVNVWLFVDDVDATFINTEAERLKASTFFSACRNLVNAVGGLCIRASVRLDVWSILAHHDEALDKCEQYMLDLAWSTEETGRILENKIISYLLRYYPDDPRFISWKQNSNRDAIRRHIFKEPFNWAGRPLESFRPIHILSAGRPRWAAQLCKMAGKDAFGKNHTLIAMNNVREVLKSYGKFRIADLYKEHLHQCPRLEEVIEAFSGGIPRYTTKELLSVLTDKLIRNRGLPVIDGIPAVNGSLTVAHFLYRIGFVTGRDENDAAGLGFIRFEDRPNLLSTAVNLDDDNVWEIHPAYRDVLRIRE